MTRFRSVQRLLIVTLALSVLVAGPIAVVGGSADHQQSQPDAATVGSSDPLSAGPEDVDPDQVRMDIALAEDGSAAWTVEFWVRLDDEETTEAFAEIERDIADDPEPRLNRFADRIEGTAATASDTTGREMTVDGFAIETERQSLARDYGLIRYTFDWDGFAVSEGNELRAGDAIDGLFLDDGTRLLIAWPETYDLTDVSPATDDRRQHAVIWRGSSTEFVSGEPRLVVSSGETGGLSGLSIAIGIGALGIVGLAVAVWYRRQSGGEAGIPTAKAGGDNAGDVTTATDGDDETAAADRETVPEEFLSNEERVLRLLADRGGRMKQQDVVSELGWTDAKTSKVVSSLREDGEVESFRLGRENVLSLPDREAEAAEANEQGT